MLHLCAVIRCKSETRHRLLASTVKAQSVGAPCRCSLAGADHYRQRKGQWSPRCCGVLNAVHFHFVHTFIFSRIHRHVHPGTRAWHSYNCLSFCLCEFMCGCCRNPHAAKHMLRACTHNILAGCVDRSEHHADSAAAKLVQPRLGSQRGNDLQQ